MNRLFVTVEDIAAVLAQSYTVIRVYTDTAESGTFVALDGLITLVAGQESYEYTDIDGTADTWYKTAYYGAVPGEGDQSAARKGETAAAYATVKEFRSEVQVTSTTTDLFIGAVLDAAKEVIDRVCNRPDGFVAVSTATARYYSGSGDPYQFIHECAAISAVAVKDSPSDDETDYTAWTLGTVGTTDDADVFAATGSPKWPEFNRTPYTLLILGSNGAYSSFTSGSFTSRGGFRPTSLVQRGVPTVKVTARWGYALVCPYQITQACLMQAARWYQRLKASMADTIAGPEFGAMMFRKVLDPDIELLLVQSRFVRPSLGKFP